MKFPAPFSPVRDELLIVTSRLNGLRGLRGESQLTPQRMLLFALAGYALWKLLRK